MSALVRYCLSCGEANVSLSGHYVCGGDGKTVVLAGKPWA